MTGWVQPLWRGSIRGGGAPSTHHRSNNSMAVQLKRQGMWSPSTNNGNHSLEKKSKIRKYKTGSFKTQTHRLRKPWLPSREIENSCFHPGIGKGMHQTVTTKGMVSSRHDITASEESVAGRKRDKTHNCPYLQGINVSHTLVVTTASDLLLANGLNWRLNGGQEVLMGEGGRQKQDEVWQHWALHLLAHSPRHGWPHPWHKTKGWELL